MKGPASRPEPLAQRVLRVRAIVADIDGTLTDGGMYYSDGEQELKKFNVRDGAGVALFRAAGVRVVFASGETHPGVARRAVKLRADACFVGCRDKRGALEAWLTENGLQWPNLACVGDEINDILLARSCGVALAVADASPLFQEEADRVLASRGGEGALREAALWLLDEQGTLQQALDAYLADSCRRE